MWPVTTAPGSTAGCCRPGCHQEAGGACAQMNYAESQLPKEGIGLAGESWSSVLKADLFSGLQLLAQ